MALRHAAVLRNPGSYVMSPASSADVLICRRSTARIVPSWTGISYCLAVRLSTTVRVSLGTPDRKSTRLNSSHDQISYAVFCLKKKKKLDKLVLTVGRK